MDSQTRWEEEGETVKSKVKERKRRVDENNDQGD